MGTYKSTVELGKREVPVNGGRQLLCLCIRVKVLRTNIIIIGRISLLSVSGKVYGRVLTEKLTEVTEGKVSKEQGGFRKGKGCVAQIFAIKMIIEEYSLSMSDAGL